MNKFEEFIQGKNKKKQIISSLFKREQEQMNQEDYGYNLDSQIILMQNNKDIHASKIDMGGCKNSHSNGYKMLKKPLRKVNKPII